MAISKVPPSDGDEDEAFDEREFAAALASGDLRRALTLLMTHHGDRVYRYAVAMTGSHQLADEVRQVVFVEAYRDLQSFAGRGSVQSWLFGIARHRCLDATKSHKRWNHRYKNDAPSDPDIIEPDLEVDRPRLVRILAQCVRKLAPAAREAVMLRYQQELSYAEVAAMVGHRVATVQQRVARALPVLRRCVDAELNPGGVT